MLAMNRIKVMIVDDSAVVRQVMVGVLAEDPGIEVIAAVADPHLRHERMKKQWPDVILLDVEMPRMDGITFLKKLMQERPTPVVICSTLTEAGAPTTIEALSAGAVSDHHQAEDRLEAVHERVGTGSDHRDPQRPPVSTSSDWRAPHRIALRGAAKNSADVMLKRRRASQAMTQTTEHIVAIGTSTGGTQALQAVLSALPAVIARHRHRPTHAAAISRRRSRPDWTACVRSRSGKRRTTIASFPGPR